MEDFDKTADGILADASTRKKPRKPREPKAATKAAAKTVTRKKRPARLMAYQVHEAVHDELDAPGRTINAGVYGPFETHDAMVKSMAVEGVQPGDEVIVFREVRRGPVKTKTWIG